MVISCSAWGCTNRFDKEKKLSFHKFPTKNQSLTRQWIAAFNRENFVPSKYSMICGEHFEPGSFYPSVTGCRRLREDSVPTIFSFPKHLQKKRVKPQRQRKLHDRNLPTELIPEEPKPIVPSARVPSEHNYCETQDTNWRKKFEASNTVSIIKFEEIECEPDIPESFSSLPPDSSYILPSLHSSIILPSPDSSYILPSPEASNIVPSPDSSNTKKDKYIKQLEDKTSKYDKCLGSQDKVIADDLRKKARHNVIRKYKGKALAKKNTVKNIVNDDQLTVLENKSSCDIKWSDAAIKSALELKFSCGDGGYSCLLRQNFPLPSTRTISRRLENLKFESGILEEVINFLQIKTVNMKEHEKECVLVLDNMAITAKVDYDSSTDDFFGEVTLPKHNGAATHALVFMLGGITSRWKQTVAYYLTGNAVDGSVLKDVSLDIIIRVEKIGLKVVCISSDMDAASQGMWKGFGIIDSNSKPTCSIAHPCDQARKLHFLPDVPHLFKNIREAVISREVIEISEEIQCKFNLPTKTVAAEHLLLIDFHNQKVKKKKVTSKITKKHLKPNHFDNMKVNQARQVIRHDTPNGLKFLAKESNDPGLLTSTWFLGIVEKWFELMTSTHPVTALSHLNKEVYQEKIQFLKNVVEIFETMRVGNTGYWKSVQTGVIMATTSMLEIQHSFLHEKNWKFLLTSRFSRDRIDNLFSCFRHKQIVPNALQFKNNLKLICIAQYLKNTSCGDYDQDDREFLSGFLLDAIKDKEA